MNSQIISSEGYAKLKEEMEYLSTAKRREIADRIEAAKELGDLAENAEYADAKEAQAFNEGRIGELANLLKNLTVVESEKTGLIGMGSKIKVEVNANVKEFVIVSFNEADPLVGKISNESPLGLSLLGHKNGDIVKVKTPKGDCEYKIINVE